MIFPRSWSSASPPEATPLSVLRGNSKSSSCYPAPPEPGSDPGRGGIARQPDAAALPLQALALLVELCGLAYFFPQCLDPQVLARAHRHSPAVTCCLRCAHRALPTRHSRCQTRTSPSNQSALMKSDPLRLVIHRCYWSSDMPIIRSANELTSRFLGRLLGSADAMLEKAGT